MEAPEGLEMDIRELHGNLLAAVSALLAMSIYLVGGTFGMENPLRSFLWTLESINSKLMARCPMHPCYVDQCMYGLAPSDFPDLRYRKPTIVYICNPYNTLGTYHLDLRCHVYKAPGKLPKCGHVHLKCEGRVQLEDGTWIKRSEEAGHYPEALAKAIVRELM